jgi:tetratricopeptide (TPR) repeat protein
MCKLLKNDKKLLPFKEVDATLRKFQELIQLEKVEGENVSRISEFCISYADYQFGDRILGEWYCERDGSRVDNWKMDLNIQFFNLIVADNCMESISSIYKSKTRHYSIEKAIHHYERVLSVMEPWRIEHKLDESKRIYNLKEEQADIVYYKLSETERQLSYCYCVISNYDKASEHCDKAIAHANEVVFEESRIDLLFNALKRRGHNIISQHKYSEARSVYEDLYNLVAEAYYVDHPLVLEAANFLIKVLIQLKEFETAGGYARITYECLTRPVDPESIDVATAADSLANIIFESVFLNGVEGGNIVEAEMLSRKALRIIEKIHGVDSTATKRVHLSDILSVEGNHDDERKSLLEECLTINIRLFGINGGDTQGANSALAYFHTEMADYLPPCDERTEQLRIANTYQLEASRIDSVLSSHPSDAEVENTDLAAFHRGIADNLPLGDEQTEQINLWNAYRLEALRIRHMTRNQF